MVSNGSSVLPSHPTDDVPTGKKPAAAAVAPENPSPSARVFRDFSAMAKAKTRTNSAAPSAKSPAASATDHPAGRPRSGRANPQPLTHSKPLRVRNKAEAAAMPPPDPNAILLTEEQAATLMHLSKYTLLRWRHDRKGPPWVQIGEHRIGYLRSTIDKWIAAQEVEL